VWVLVFAVLCILAWWRDWHWLAKVVSVAGVVSGLIGIAGDVSAILDRGRTIRQVETANEGRT
jgi:O-antigen ligase